MRHDLTDLRLFLNVGETLNLTRAAERTFLSLPAASARVKHMEEAFKARLLVRLATGVALTPAGEVLLKHANAVFRQLECLNADLQPYASGLKGRLRLLANTTATNSFLADALSTFLAENPDVDVELEEKISGDIVIAIRAGAGDLGLVAGNIDVEGLDVTPLFRDELTVVTALDHPLAASKSAHFADLVDAYQFVGIHPDSAIQTFLEDIASGLGKRICQRVHVGSFEAVCRMVEAGAGIAVVPRACAARYSRPDALHVLKLEDPWALRDRLLCRQRGRDLPSFAECFIEHVQRAARGQ
ncbi:MULTISPECIES: LysR family transcriptional regulator [Achromobacter]|uniref:LysR family transcriptional regulator n=1 Tax=Achromobacter spanius TaxID=217203 RepID=A0ABY8GRZ4_9BURK|nr:MULTISPECIES: LysR family transcriptional regulator [Achromobacter]WAI83375.1 LysR family transcriptional regulator [Achromobacter spanius]WEX93461.1 LysR family transcriptional regulator [Achromobacter sp. SS2-2022]WFP07381.1 LysR family transcriptional regulator [Achromobacter spanius]